MSGLHPRDVSAPDEGDYVTCFVCLIQQGEFFGTMRRLRHGGISAPYRDHGR